MIIVSRKKCHTLYTMDIIEICCYFYNHYKVWQKMRPEREYHLPKPVSKCVEDHYGLHSYNLYLKKMLYPISVLYIYIYIFLDKPEVIIYEFGISTGYHIILSLQLYWLTKTSRICLLFI